MSKLLQDYTVQIVICLVQRESSKGILLLILLGFKALPKTNYWGAFSPGALMISMPMHTATVEPLYSGALGTKKMCLV